MRCTLFTDTVSVTCILFTDTVSVRCILFTDTVSVNYLFPKLSPPIYACVNGRLVCDACKPRLPHCGICREALGGRPTDMEQIIAKLIQHARN